MRSRCLYQRRGYEGITICERWSTFEAFFEDMGPKPHPEWELDRERPEEGYSKANCRWLSRKDNLARRRMPGRSAGGTYTPHRYRPVTTDTCRSFMVDTADASGRDALVIPVAAYDPATDVDILYPVPF